MTKKYSAADSLIPLTQVTRYIDRASEHDQRPLTHESHMRLGGFTLVELLVVIAVIAVLSSLVLVAVQSSAVKVRGASCRNNHRQLAIAMITYCGDHGGKFPSNRDGVAEEGLSNWVAGNMSSGPGDLRKMIDPTRSEMATYFAAPKILKCPADRSPLARSVSLNNHINPIRTTGGARWIGGQNRRWVSFISPDEVRIPSEIFMFIDESSDSINDAYFAVDPGNTGSSEGEGVSRPYYMVDYPSTAHAGGAGTAFVDGHSDIAQWKESTTFEGKKNYGGATYTSQTDQDAAWLQTHSTEKIRP